MPLPVIADTYQLRLIFTGSPLQRPATCALHFRDPSTTQTVNDLLTDANASATANMWNLVSSNVGVTRINGIKLDGTSAGVDMTISAFPAKWTGSGGADCVPQGAAVISLKSLLRGPKHRNRIYLPAIAEAKSADGVLDSATVAACNTAWIAFNTAMEAAGWQMGVVSPTDQTINDLQELIVRPYLKTQRRRSKR